MKNINIKGYVNEDSIRESQLFLRVLEKYLFSYGYESKNLGVYNNTYALWYNMIFFNLFYLLVKEIFFVLQSKYAVKGDVMTDKDCELFNALDYLKKDLLTRLDPYIRCQLQKRGVSIIQNVYVGFDTEYELSDYSKYQNQLVSSQLAVQSRTLIKVPLYKTLDFSYIHSITSNISTFTNLKLITEEPLICFQGWMKMTVALSSMS